MANPEGAKKTGEAIVVSTTPDVCKTPMGSSTPPVPYQIIGNFRDSASVSPNVNFTSDPAFLLDKSRITKVTGDEAGVAGGIKSGTNKNIVEPVEASPTVRVNKKRVVRHGDRCKMNNGNTFGKVIYQKGSGSTGTIKNDGKPSADTNPPGFLKGLTDAAKKDWEGFKKDVSKLWDASGLSSATAEQATIARADIGEGIKGIGSFAKDILLIQYASGSPQGQEAMERMSQMGKTLARDISQTYQQSYAEGGLTQAGGTASWGMVSLVAQAFTTKGVGKVATVTKEASTLEKVALLAKKGEEMAGVEKRALKARKGRGVKITPRKTPEIKPKCFRPGKALRKTFKNDRKKMEKEFYAQLKRQEEGINKMTVGEFLDNLKKFEAKGRGSGAAQSKARDKLGKEIKQNIQNSLKNKGIFGKKAKNQALDGTKEAMKNVAALHNPDMKAGGHNKIGGFGDSRVNSSIGSQWNKDNRIPEMRADAEKAMKDLGPDAKMNVKLERCK